MPNGLASKKCTPCRGGVPPMEEDQIEEKLQDLAYDWEVLDGKKIRHEFELEGFLEAIDFINDIAEIAEAEGHHPDIHNYYDKVVIELWTHKIDGLYINDFIMAAKIEALYDERSSS